MAGKEILFSFKATSDPEKVSSLQNGDESVILEKLTVNLLDDQSVPRTPKEDDDVVVDLTSFCI